MFRYKEESVLTYIDCYTLYEGLVCYGSFIPIPDIGILVHIPTEYGVYRNMVY